MRSGVSSGCPGTCSGKMMTSSFWLRRAQDLGPHDDETYDDQGYKRPDSDRTTDQHRRQEVLLTHSRWKEEYEMFTRRSIALAVLSALLLIAFVSAEGASDEGKPKEKPKAKPKPKAAKSGVCDFKGNTWKDSLSQTEKMWAGSLARLCAQTMLHPLDTIRTRRQVCMCVYIYIYIYIPSSVSRFHPSRQPCRQTDCSSYPYGEREFTPSPCR